MDGDPSPLHGQGWLGAWEVAFASAAEAELHFHHQAGEWPWTYLARQHFRLDEAGLTIELICRNLSAEPMPCGLGQHPYFHCTLATRLQTQVEHVWTIDDKVLPVDRIAATGQYDLSDRCVCGMGLDNGFDGWSGTALVSDPEWPFAITMSSPGTRFFQLYSPPSGNIVVIGPVTHANAALNAPEEEWPELGIRILSQNEEMTLTTRFEVV
jgi:aldose 1-epimerase